MKCPSYTIDLRPPKKAGINLNPRGCETLVEKRNNAQLEMEERERERTVMMDCYYMQTQ